MDWDKYSIEAEVTVPKPVKLMGDYKINGKVLILPIQGNGLSNLTLGAYCSNISDLNQDGG